MHFEPGLWTALAKWAPPLFKAAVYVSKLFRSPDRLVIEHFEPARNIINDGNDGETSVRIKIWNPNRSKAAEGVRVNIKRLVPIKVDSRDAVEMANQFDGHPLRQSRDHRPPEGAPQKDDESFSIHADSSAEIMLCFRTHKLQDGKPVLYFSAPWSKYKHGECFTELGIYAVTVVASAENMGTAEPRTFSIQPGDKLGLIVCERGDPS